MAVGGHVWICVSAELSASLLQSCITYALQAIHEYRDLVDSELLDRVVCGVGRTVPFYNGGILMEHCDSISHCTGLGCGSGEFRTAMVVAGHLEVGLVVFGAFEAYEMGC